MLGNILFIVGLLISVGIGFVYFRDLGDVSQMVLRIKRVNLIRFIRNESRLLIIGFCGTAIITIGYFLFEGGTAWLFWSVLVLVCVLYGFTWFYVHVGMRNQMSTATYYSIEEAKEFVNPSSSVGAWYNDSGMPVTNIDFFGASDQGQLKRVETFKSGMFWHVWVEFFQHTDINRIVHSSDIGDKLSK